MSTDAYPAEYGPVSRLWDRRPGRSSKWISRQLRLRIYARDGHRCVHCGSSDRLSLDHITPRSMRGSHAPTNLVTACLSCNSRRQDEPFPPADLARLRALAREKLPTTPAQPPEPASHRPPSVPHTAPR